MVKYFFLKRHGSKLIQKERVSILQDNTISLSTVKNWFKRFKSGDLSCSDEKRPGRSLMSLGPDLHRFLKKFPFVSARVMARHFSVDRHAFKNIFDRKLAFRKFNRRWGIYILSAEEKLRIVTESQILLTIRVTLRRTNFRGSLQERILIRLLNRIQRDVRFLSC
jgi:hypothetical protein